MSTVRTRGTWSTPVTSRTCATNPSAACSPSDRSADQDPPGDLPVVLPERDPAGQVRVVRRRLHRAVGVERPGPDGVLALGRRAPVVSPEAPGEAVTLVRVVQRRGPPRSLVDLDLDAGDRCTPCD